MPPLNALIEISDHSLAHVMTSATPVLLAFCAATGSSSQRLRTLLTETATNSADQVIIAVANPATAPGLAARFDITTVPATLLFVGGCVHFQFVGEISRRELMGLLVRARRWADGQSAIKLPGTSPIPAQS